MLWFLQLKCAYVVNIMTKVLIHVVFLLHNNGFCYKPGFCGPQRWLILVNSWHFPYIGYFLVMLFQYCLNAVYFLFSTFSWLNNIGNSGSWFFLLGPHNFCWSSLQRECVGTICDSLGHKTACTLHKFIQHWEGRIYEKMPYVWKCPNISCLVGHQQF